MSWEDDAAEAIRRALAPTPAERVVDEISSAVANAFGGRPAGRARPVNVARPAPRRRGQRPDGSPVSESEKARAFARYEALRDEHYGRGVPGPMWNHVEAEMERLRQDRVCPWW